MWSRTHGVMMPTESCLILFCALLMASLSLVPTIDALTQEEYHNSEASSGANLLRKSIVFDLKTPKVFYCPQEKQSDTDKMIVKARPLDKLCEFQGQQKPRTAPSDCYNDVDETDYACDEKRRFMIRLDLASEISELAGATELDQDFVLSKGASKKKTNGKKF